MIKAHPTDAMLHAYVAGELNSASALVVSTHLDMCPHCRRMANAVEEELACEFESAPAAQLDGDDMHLMLDAIFSSSAPKFDTEVSPYPAQAEAQAPVKPKDAMITLEGKRFQLPRSLANQKHRIGPWSKMMGNMWRAPINLGTDEVANLIYMDRATSVPEHTHRGTELQLVINGVFKDEYGSYSDGDMLVLDHTHQHTPETTDEDCLILAVMDAPLHFTSGISRLLNPFSSLFFR